MAQLGDTELLRISQVAGRLALGQTKVRELLRSGELRSVRIGRAVRVPASEVAAFVAAKTEAPR